MPHATAAFMYSRVATIGADARAHRRIIRVPLITALIEPGSRYTLTDPRIALPPPPPAAITDRRGRPRGPSAATIQKMWDEAGHDRAVFRRRLDARLMKAGVMRSRDTDDDIERMLGEGDIDAPFMDDPREK